MALIVRGQTPTNVFGLHKSDENSVTYALGWTLERSAAFAAALLERLTGSPMCSEGALIELQKYGADKGFTDVELRVGSVFHAIFEAKRSWDVPSAAQLHKYRPRLAVGAASRQMIVSISSGEADIVGRDMPADIDGAEVAHLSWGDVRKAALAAQRRASGFEEKLWLQQFVEHMREFVAMDRITDNTVYIVALSKDRMRQDGPKTWIDVVAQDGHYFHPVGNGWPPQPPHYIGFRYHGKLQTIHRVEQYEVMLDVSQKNAEWFQTTRDHFVYRLGRAIRPAAEVKTGALYKSGRVYCAIDTLLSGEFSTIKAARDETRQRLASI